MVVNANVSPKPQPHSWDPLGLGLPCPPPPRDPLATMYVPENEGYVAMVRRESLPLAEQWAEGIVAAIAAGVVDDSPAIQAQLARVNVTRTRSEALRESIETPPGNHAPDTRSRRGDPAAVEHVGALPILTSHPDDDPVERAKKDKRNAADRQRRAIRRRA